MISDPHDYGFEDEINLNGIIVVVCVGQCCDGKGNRFGEVNEEGGKITDDIKN